MNTTYSAFEQRYQQGGWNGMGSGPGSAPAANVEYLSLLQQMIAHTPGITTVLDIGCGDWQLMRCIDLHAVQYLGVDVAQSMIDKNRERFASPNVQFELLDPPEQEFPRFDLAIIKDVLQHLPYAAAAELLRNAVRSCRWVLVTNDYVLENNRDIEVGDYRPINMLTAPFKIPGVVLLAYGDKRTVLFSGQRSGS